MVMMNGENINETSVDGSIVKHRLRLERRSCISCCFSPIVVVVRKRTFTMPFFCPMKIPCPTHNVCTYYQIDTCVYEAYNSIIVPGRVCLYDDSTSMNRNKVDLRE